MQSIGRVLGLPFPSLPSCWRYATDVIIPTHLSVVCMSHLKYKLILTLVRN